MKPYIETILKPIVRKVRSLAIRPSGPARYLYRGIFYGQRLGLEAYIWAQRSLIATPAFLSIAECYGARIAVDRIPFVTGLCRITLGNDIRISGKLSLVVANSDPKPVLQIGNGVFIGYDVTLSIASRIEIGNYVAIGEGTTITDTEGHNRYNNERKPAWEEPAGQNDVAPVVIEDGVWIGERVAILKGVRIGEGSIIGYGAVVRSSVPPHSMVVGNPARSIPINVFKNEAGGAKNAT